MGKTTLMSVGFFGAFVGSDLGSGFYCNVLSGAGAPVVGEDPWCSAGLRFCCEG